MFELMCVNNLTSVSGLLLFSPIRLVVLIGWMYLCLYLSQRVQFSPLISTRHRSIASLMTLIFGPFFYGILFFIDVRQKMSEDDHSFMDALKIKIQTSMDHLGSARKSKGLSLLDTSGRNLKEIYGHGKHKKEESTILALTEQIISDAIADRASDILIDPKNEESYTLRFRVDGVLRTVDTMDSLTSQAVINSIKAVANMDIAERRRPQDGAFVAKTDTQTFSFRTATAGVMNGEKLSIRVLGQQAGQHTLNNIGLSEKQRVVIERGIAKPSGMILLCGPTGSGKTTTLYAMLNVIDLYTRNVITVEDPIEYVLPDASQIEVNPKAGITFAKVLRNVLRQDPDIICVGEVRDEETASIALRAAQTGHLVIATIHCNSNAAALVRLLDLGISPILMSSGLDMIISQRLLRVLCEDCKQPASFNQNQIEAFRKKRINYQNICQPAGCQNCSGTGYYGRTAIFDILLLTEEIKDKIANSQRLLEEMRKEGDKKGRSNMKKQAWKKIVSGITTIEEMKRVVG